MTRSSGRYASLRACSARFAVASFPVRSEVWGECTPLCIPQPRLPVCARLLDVPRCGISNPAPACKKRSLLVLWFDESHVVYWYRFIDEREVASS